MIEIMKTNSSELMPETKEEAFGELMGRVNTLRNWLMDQASVSTYFSSDQRMVCTLMGFRDVIVVANAKMEPTEVKEEKERAGVGSTD